jgi:hypothetical protein
MGSGASSTATSNSERNETNKSQVSTSSAIKSIFDTDDNVLPPIRLIDFNKFSECGSFPRYPENQNITTTLDTVMVHRDSSLIIFISHCWLRGYAGAEGYDGRPHPDSKNGDKFRLIVDGITKIKQTLAPGMKHCYVWLDFGCMDQDGNPAGELKQLDKIVQCCDCLFTPIFDPDWQSWDFPAGGIANHYKDYKAKLWNDGDFAYVNRAWCRVEMFYASNIPLLESHESRLQSFKAGLGLHARNGVRPHILYGDREFNELIAPIILPPLQNSYYDQLDPLKGKLSVSSDMIHIEGLIKVLEPYKKIQKEGYKGEYNKNGLRHGKGIYKYASGGVYDGEWKDNKMHGKGIYNYTDGGIFDGEWKNGKKHGKGVFKYASGSVYDGEWKDDKMHGKGIYNYADGDIYDGEWKDGKKHGKGIYTYACGNVYDGEWKDGNMHGKGILKYDDGGIYDGDWKDDNRHGKGTINYADGGMYDGDWKDDNRRGKGIYIFADGGIYDGEWEDGNMHGKGIYKYADGDVYDGEWKDDKKHGKGVFKYANGEKIDGVWNNDELLLSS